MDSEFLPPTLDATDVPGMQPVGAVYPVFLRSGSGHDARIRLIRAYTNRGQAALHANFLNQRYGYSKDGPHFYYTAHTPVFALLDPFIAALLDKDGSYKESGHAPPD